MVVALRNKTTVAGRVVMLALAAMLLPVSARAEAAPTASICGMAASSQYEAG